MHGFRSSNPLLPLVLVGCCTVAGHADDDPPFDPTSPADVAERNDEEDSGETDLSGPSVEPQGGRRGGGVPGSPGAQPEPGMRGGGVMNVVNVLTTHCARCHGAQQQKGGLQILPLAQLFTGSQDYWVVRRGSPRESELYRRITLSASHEEIMPPDGEPMSPAEIEVVADWIRSGAPTDVEPVRRQRAVRPRQWFQLYMQLELEPAQRTAARDAIASFDRDNRSFEREYRDRIAELRRIAQSPVSAMRSQEDIDAAKSELERLNALKRKADEVQATLWAGLTSSQQEVFRERLARAAAQSRDGAGRSNRRGERGRQESGTLTPDEQRRLRDLMRPGRDQGDSGGDSGGE